MPAAYIDENFVDAMIGEALREELHTDDPDDGYLQSSFDTIVELASERVRGWAASSGYETALGDTTTDARVKLATYGVYVELAFGRPSKNLPLPEGWSDHPAQTAIQEIHDGTMKLAADPTASTAVGGMIFSSGTDRPAYTDRDDLADY